MRNFRTAAVAAATALTLGLTGTSVASAQEGDDVTETQEQNASLSSGIATALSSGSSAAGNDQGAWKENEDGQIEAPLVTGEDMFGDDVADLPAWAQNWKDFNTVASVGAVVGLIVAAVNAAKYVGLLPR